MKFAALPIFLLLHGAIKTNGQFVANVTKPSTTTSEIKVIRKNIITSTTNRPTTQSPLPVEKEFFVPKAISIETGDSQPNGYVVYQMPAVTPPAKFPDSGVEETFTYQVKKQKKSPFDSPSSDINSEFEYLKKRAQQSESYVALKNYVNELNYDIHTKVYNLTSVLETISSEAYKNNSALNSTIQHLNGEVTNLTSMSREALRSTKVLQYVHDQDKANHQDQIMNLTKNIEQFRKEKSEEIRGILRTLSTLQEKLENTTREIRVHEAYLRYGQQTMSSMRSSIENNLDKISELELADGPQWVDHMGCGGVVEANSGIISYKFRQPYWNNERCVWIIRANRKAKINLQLLEDGFQNQSNSDFLTVTEFLNAEDQHPVAIITSSRLEHGNKVLHTFQGPVIFLTFYSNGSTPGTGFVLRFDGIGNTTNPFDLNAIRHLNHHFASLKGEFTYPRENKGDTYQPNELVAIAINPYNASLVKIQMKMSDLEKDEHCEFDSVNFYGSVTGSYALSKRYCQQNEKFTGEIIQSSDGLFLVIFRSDASTQYSGFQFSWEAE